MFRKTLTLMMAFTLLAAACVPALAFNSRRFFSTFFLYKSGLVRIILTCGQRDITAVYLTRQRVVFYMEQ